MAMHPRPTTHLREWRQQRYMTQAVLAELMGMSERSIERWENGQGQPGPYACRKLMELTGLTPQQLGLVPCVLEEVPPLNTDPGEPDPQIHTPVGRAPHGLLLVLFAGSLLLLSTAVLLLVTFRLWH